MSYIHYVRGVAYGDSAACVILWGGPEYILSLAVFILVVYGLRR